MINESIRKKVELYERIIEKFKLFSVYDKRQFDKFHSWKKSNKHEIKKLWVNFLRKNKEHFLSLYIHFPYCKTRCNFCIYSSNEIINSNAIDSYLNSLEEEIIFFSPVFSQYKFKTFYLGGGTPNLLNNEQLKKILNLVNDNFKFEKDSGTRCLEISPFSINKKIFLLAKENGIDRISMGIESLDPKVIKTSNRKYVHYDKIKKITEFINNQGFRDFNVDLMAWLPDDTIHKFIDGFEKMMQLDVPSITIYFYRHEVNKFNISIAEKTHRKYVNYKVPYDRKELLKKLKPLLKKYLYYSKDKNLNKVCHVFFKKEQIQPIVNPTSPDWVMKNSTLGFGLYSQSFLEHFVLYSNTNNDPKKISFDNTTYYTTEYSEDYCMREYVLQEFEQKSNVSIKSFHNIFNKDILEVFKDEINNLLELKKIKIHEDKITFITKDIYEFSVYIKFFYNQEQLKKLIKT